jgi:hypothetical protein
MIEVTLFKLFLTLGQLSNQLPPHKWTLQWSHCHESWANYGLEELHLVAYIAAFAIIFLFSFCWSVQFLRLMIKIHFFSVGMLDHIMVENADVKVALNRIAVVSVLDAHTLSVMPYDPTVRSISFLKFY